MNATRPQVTFPSMWYLASRTCPEAEHPLRDEFLDWIKDHAEAMIGKRVAVQFLAQAKREAVVRADVLREAREFPEVTVVDEKVAAAEAKRARKAKRLQQQLAKV